MPKSFGNQGTHCLSITLLVLVVLQVVAGVAAIIVVEVFKHSLLKYIGPDGRGEIQVALFFTDLFCAQLIVYYSCGILLVKKLSRDPCSPNMSTLLCLWHFFIIVVIISGFLMSLMIFRNSESMEKSTEMSLLRGIEVYYSDPEWRLAWDDLQYHEECCGVQSYKDWQTTAWIEEISENKGGRYSSRQSEMISLTPYSCCKRDVDCFENYVPQRNSETWVELPTMNVSAINQTGCLVIFSGTLQSLLLSISIMNVLVLLIELVILILMKILFVKMQSCGLAQRSDSECQATILVKCPRNFQCDVAQASELEETDVEDRVESDEQVHRRGCPCRERRRVSFGYEREDDEFSPLLLH